MARRARSPHELTLRNHHGRAVCTYKGQVYPFGAWDPPTAGHPAGQPNAAAVLAFQEQQRIWAGAAAAPGADPSASLANPGASLASVWASWMRSAHAPRDRRDENRRSAVEIFGTADKPGPFRDTLARDLTAAAVLAWQDGLCARGLSRYTVGRVVGFLRRCLAWGRVAGLVPAQVVSDVELVPPPPKDATPRPKVRRGVTWEQVAEVCERMKSAVAADVLRVLWYSGARPSEVERITVGMVLRSGTVRPEKGQPVALGRCWAVNFGRDSKTGEERCLFFGPRAQAVIGPYLEKRPAGAVLFQTREGKPYTYRLLTQAIQRACGWYKGKRGQVAGGSGAAKVKPAGLWGAYNLRHGAAERVQAHYSGLVPGAGWLAAQSFLGHKIKGVTSGYSGADWVTAERVAAELG